MIFDVNTNDEDLLPRPAMVQWGIRGLNSMIPSKKPYRYFILRLPWWRRAEDKFRGALFIDDLGEPVYSYYWANLTILYTTRGYPKQWRFYWDRIGESNAEA